MPDFHVCSYNTAYFVLPSFPVQILPSFFHQLVIFILSEIFPEYTLALNDLFPSLNSFDTKDLFLT